MQKLLDWHARWAELEASHNPFALVMMAHLKAQECQDGPARKGWKLRLVRLLYQRGYTREQVLQLFGSSTGYCAYPRRWSASSCTN